VWKSSISKYVCKQVESKSEGYEAYIPNLKKISNNIKPSKIDTTNWWNGYLDLDFYENKEPVITPYTKSEKRRLKRVVINDFLSNYSNYSYRLLESRCENKAKCSKCGNSAYLVGRKFSHCKTDKAWKELESKVIKGEIDLYNDFYDYPRELINNPI